MSIATDFTDPVTGFNDRAEALASAAVAAYENTTREAVEAVIAERASLVDAILSCLLNSTSIGSKPGIDGGTKHSGWAAHPDRNPDRAIEAVWLAVNEASLDDVLLMKLDERWFPWDANGFDAATRAASGVAKIAALQAPFQAAAA